MYSVECTVNSSRVQRAIGIPQYNPCTVLWWLCLCVTWYVLRTDNNIILYYWLVTTAYGISFRVQRVVYASTVCTQYSILCTQSGGVYTVQHAVYRSRTCTQHAVGRIVFRS